MISTSHLLIGGGLSSSQAAKIIRMKAPEDRIVLVSAELHLPYDRPPLSKELLRGEKTPEEIAYDGKDFFEQKKIQVLLGSPVVELDPDGHRASLGDGETIVFEKAFLATGGEPIRLDVPGASLEGIHYLRTLDDALEIIEDAGEGKRAIVVGAGFIGMEVAASLTLRGAEVTVIETLPHIWPRFLDANLAGYIQEYCGQRGVRFLTQEEVTAFEGTERVTAVTTSSGQALPCDFVCVGIGIRPSVSLAETAGLDVDDGVVVNEYLQTSHPDIYAGGDMVEFPDPVFGRRRRVEHWGHAEYCGQVAGLNMTGARQAYDLLSYVWSDIFDLHIEFAGDEGERDRVLLRGKLGDPSFVVLYLKNDTLRAYFAINASSREFPRLQKLIRRSVDLGGRDDELKDPSFDLKALL